MGQVTFSFDGFRKTMCKDLAELTEHIESFAESLDFYDRERLIELHDQVAQNIGVLNCIYSDTDENFSDLSEQIKVRFLGDD